MSSVVDDGPRPGTLTIRSAARVLRVSESTVYRMIDDGRIAAFEHCRNSYVSRRAIDDYWARLDSEAAKRRGAKEKSARGQKRVRKPRPLKAVAG